MANQQTIQVPVGKLSRQMCAVLRIVTADQDLSNAVFRFIDIQNDSVDWEPVFGLDLSAGNRAAIQIAYAVWTDQLKAGTNLFEDALNMTPDLKRACLKAIGMRWNL